jgi:hypothetical protein
MVFAELRDMVICIVVPFGRRNRGCSQTVVDGQLRGKPPRV